jgi:signal transduction histidine kinase
MKRNLMCVAATCLLSTAWDLQALAEDAVVRPTDAQSLVKFVEQAAALVTRKGDNCFPELHQPPWFDGETYVAVSTRLGETFVNPASQQLEGKNLHDLLDVDGRAILGLIIRSVSWSKGAGWAHYSWPRPGQTKPSWKSTYSIQVTAPSGRIYIISSGLYDLPANRLFLEDAVNRAAERITALGPEAFKELNDRLGPYRFQDTYVFVFDGQGKELVSPDFPELAGRSVLDVNHGDAQPPARAMLEGLRTTDRGWFDYRWPKPGDGAVTRKTSYARRVGHQGQTYIVAAGMFIE